jgi:hypothetical protein
MPKQTKSKVNEAGNYTKPAMRKQLFNKIKAGSKGGKPGFSGRPGRPKCLPRNTKPRAAGIVVKLSLTSILRI